ncbi:3-dehydroquinate synthase family protein [Micromonospora sp. CPCC 206061]|uniref:3-dehydroquinate synthase family protein n=1 Tax=Micromonospora sp. CPCC 206061 TaxID=3122410 RepID=UPI002FF0E406
MARVIRVVTPASSSPVVLGRLAAHNEAEWRLAVVPGLLDPDNRALLGHLAGVRRVLVVAGAPERERLVRYLDRQQAGGLLDGYCLAPEAKLVAASPLSAIAGLADAAVTSGLGRRDAILVYGHDSEVLTAVATAALLRRQTMAVQVVSDLPALLAAVRTAASVPLPGPFAVRRQQVTVVVDEDVLLAAACTPEEEAALEELATMDSGVAEALLGSPLEGEALTAVRRAALAAMFRWFGRAWTTRSARYAGAPTGRAVSYQVEAVHDVFRTTSRPDGRGQRDTADTEPGAGRLAEWLPRGGRVLAVVDAYAPRIVDDVRRYLSSCQERSLIAGFEIFCVESSPAVKTLGRLDRLVRTADRMDFGPTDVLLGVGGGTVLDLVGTAALMYRGGTPYLRVPTTLVGMIDAGIGLKVAVNVGTRKNLLGGYHAPLACLCDPAFLATLPSQEVRCGLAEAIKIAMVTDGELFGLIERHHESVLTRRQSPESRRVMEGAIAAMLGELSTNPFERELRRLPDFGHEYGHLLEAESGYRLRHGEAVSIGMALASQLAVLAGRLSPSVHERMIRLLNRVGLPTFDRLCEPERLWRWLCVDIKSHKGGVPVLVAPTGTGAGGFLEPDDGLTFDTVRRACAELRA